MDSGASASVCTWTRSSCSQENNHPPTTPTPELSNILPSTHAVKQFGGVHRGDETPSIPLAGSHIGRGIKTLCTRDAAECSRVPAWVNLTTHRLLASFAAVEKQTNGLSNFTKRDRCFASTSCHQANGTILTGFLHWLRTLSFILEANEE